MATSTTLNGGITSVATSLTLTSFKGLPVANNNQAWELDITGGGNLETVRVIDSTSAPILTVMRGFRGTAAQAWSNGTTASLKGSAFSVDEQKQNKDNASGTLIGVPITGTSQLAELNTSYVIKNSSLTTITLPAAAPTGSFIHIQGYGAGGWVLAANTGQTVQVGQLATSTAGSVASAARYNAITVMCLVDNVTWGMSSSVGAGFTVT